jgi:hypothetical protein
MSDEKEKPKPIVKVWGGSRYLGTSQVGLAALPLVRARGALQRFDGHVRTALGQLTERTVGSIVLQIAAQANAHRGQVHLLLAGNDTIK